MGIFQFEPRTYFDSTLAELGKGLAYPGMRSCH